jgi:hypothetical protein
MLLLYVTSFFSDIPSSVQILECTICTTKIVFYNAIIILIELLNSSRRLEDVNTYLDKCYGKKNKNGDQTAKI